MITIGCLIPDKPCTLKGVFSRQQRPWEDSLIHINNDIISYVVLYMSKKNKIVIYTAPD